MVPTTVASTPKCASVSVSTCAVRALTSAESDRVGGLALRSARSGSRYSPLVAGSKSSAASSAVGSSSGTRSGSGGSSGGGSAESGPAATTSGYAAMPSTGTTGVRGSPRGAVSTASADGSASLQSAHSMLSIDRRAALPACRTAFPELRSSAPADAPVTSSRPARTSAIPTISEPASPMMCARLPPRADPTAPPWLSPNAIIRPRRPIATPVRKGRRSISLLRTSISPPIPRSASGTSGAAAPRPSRSQPATCAPTGPPSNPSQTTVASTRPTATSPSPQSSG